jgi:predicted O-linked N-acetylglucosamine transferase (SPINDLY family)
MQQRMRAAFDMFIDARWLSDQDISDLMKKHEIDIAVDLAGFTRDARTNIFAMRSAPVQVNYLGYPGTMGVEFIDYMIADDFVVPVANRQSYAEKIVYLPHTFQANDSKRPIAPHIGSRQDAGLPDDAFVFCSFNNTYKVTPIIFDVWMNVLSQIDGSVLWLTIDNPTAQSNLQKVAASKGVDPRRLLFTPRMNYSTYLGSYRLADLFLDTFPFNAGTTASDALWAGLPVLTYSGKAFASRMAGSLLRAINLPGLVTHSLEEYQALAISLARNREALQDIKQALTLNRLTAPLFDTSLFSRHIEAAYEAMYQRYRAGLPPDHIEIKASH